MLRTAGVLAAAVAAADATCKCGVFEYENSNATYTLPCPLVTPAGDAFDPYTQAVLPEYPRPQLRRDEAATYTNLNGFWDFQPAGGEGAAVPPPPANFTKRIVVPFPPEACLSGVFVTGMGVENIPLANNSWNFRLWYRRTFDAPKGAVAGARTLLHFGAVDWQSTVIVNGKNFGTHTGGYDAFSYDITDVLKPAGNEVLVFTYDPSDYGNQPFGKQRLSAITHPGGVFLPNVPNFDTYSPASGIWQTVWLETVPETYITGIDIVPTLTDVTITVHTNARDGVPVKLAILDGATAVASTASVTGTPTTVVIPHAKLWTPDTPFLYNITATTKEDTVQSYCGLRTIALGVDKNNVIRPLLNGKTVFLNGWLDQSFFPDGVYTPATYEVLKNDVAAAKAYGFNLIRMTEKANFPLYYYYADVLGIYVFQDAVQKYEDPHQNPSDKALFKRDYEAMLRGLKNHPSIVQWTIFNEVDTVDLYDRNTSQEFLALGRAVDPTRLFDMNSGGPANEYHYGDVNDVHLYPNPHPLDVFPHQYGMYGETGGFGLFLAGHEWVPGKCVSYENVANGTEWLQKYSANIDQLLQYSDRASVSIVTQTTDTELECDGYLTYDRYPKLTEAERVQMFNLNLKLNKALDGLEA